MARPRSDVMQRFYSKVLEMASGCHEWQSTIKKDGYGSFHHEGRQSQAHRVAYILKVGDIPKGKILLHKCDNRKCVNIDHLQLGTYRDNINDMDQKKRRGTISRLTYAQVEEIKKMLGDRYSQQKIADIYGVHQTVVSNIKLGYTKLFKPN